MTDEAPEVDMIRYHDVTDSPDDRVDYPEIVDEFANIGFRQVGRIVAEPADGDYGSLAAHYDPADQTQLLAHCDVPTPVLRSPDRSAFAEVSWFWDSPSVRLRTSLADGAVVETNRQWKNSPRLPRHLQKYWRHINIAAEMTKRSVPRQGRSVAIVDTDSTPEQWRRHQEHVASYAAERGSHAIGHETIPQALDLARRTFAHDEAVERRTVRLWKPLVVLYGVVAVALTLIVAGAVGSNQAVLFALAAIVLTPLAVHLVISRVRVLPEKWRPPFA